MSPIRSLLALLCATLLATSCSVEVQPFTPDSTAAPAAAAGTELAGSTEVDSAAYCEALARMYETQPVGVTSDEDFVAYADQIEAAAAIAEPAHRDALLMLADLNRNWEDMTAESATAAAFQSAPIYSYAQSTCGIDPAAATSGEVSVTTSGGSVSLDGDGDSSIIFPMLPTSPPTEPDRIIDSSAGADALLAHVNGLVPATTDLAFEWATVDTDGEGEYTVTALVPVGWTSSESFGVSFTNEDFGFRTELEFDSGCQGFCAPQDWAKVMVDEDASPFLVTARPDELTVLVDQELSNPSGRLLVYEDTGSFGETGVILTRWSNEADHFFECSARLNPDEDATLWPAFADACLAASADWF